MKSIYNSIKNLYYKIISKEKIKLFRYKLSTLKINNMNPVRITTFLVLFTVICLSIGYSAFGTNLNMTGTVVTVRPVFDVRVQSATKTSNTNSTINSVDYNKDRLITNVSFDENGTATYQITVINIGNTDIGINSISIKDINDNTISTVSYTLSGYTLKESLGITNGNTKTFTITLKSSTQSTYNLSVIFDFQQFYTVTYDGIDTGEELEPVDLTIGNEVFIDVLTGSRCTNYVSSNSNYEYNGTEGNSCLKFYILDANDDSTFDLILDHAVGDGISHLLGIAYGSSEGITYDGNTVLEILYLGTSSWNTSIKSDDLEYSPQLNSETYTIDYENNPNGLYKARLITGQDLYKLTGDPNSYSFDENTVDLSNYSWLYRDETETESNILGYATADTKIINRNNSDLELESGVYVQNWELGVRPVITVSKDKINNPASKFPTKVLGGDTLKVDFSDNKPGEINVKMGDSLTDAYTMKNTGKFSLNNVSGDIVFSKVAIKGTPTYFNVSTGNYCTENDYRQSFDYENYKDYLNSMTEYNGIETSSSVQNSCLKFYELTSNSVSTDYILDHDIAVGAQFNSTGYANNGPGSGSTEMMATLKSKTSSWTGTATPTDYSVYMTFVNTDISWDTTKIEYTIPYSSGGYKSRLITAEEIQTLTNASSYFDYYTAKGYNGNYYFDNTGDGKTQKLPSDGVSKYGWLMDRLTDCKSTGCYYNSINSTNVKTYDTASATYWQQGFEWAVFRTGDLRAGTADSTFTGTRPVITVNLKNSSLPDEYQQVEYIQMTGTQWIDTRYRADGYTGIDSTFQFTSTTPTQQVLFGSGTSGSLVYTFYINGGGGWSYSYNNSSGNWVAILSSADTNKHNIVFNKTKGKMTFDSRPFDLSGTTNTTTTADTIYIGSYKNASSLGAQNARVKIYKFDVYWSGTLAQRFIPCYRKSDGVIGMYETVEKRFYTNSGTGTFGKGSNVSLTR